MRGLPVRRPNRQSLRERREGISWQHTGRLPSRIVRASCEPSLPRRNCRTLPPREKSEFVLAPIFSWYVREKVAFEYLRQLYIAAFMWRMLFGRRHYGQAIETLLRLKRLKGKQKRASRSRMWDQNTPRNLHHLVPKSRGGMRRISNMLLVRLQRHTAWHQIWIWEDGENMTLDEIIEQLLSWGFEKALPASEDLGLGAKPSPFLKNGYLSVSGEQPLPGLAGIYLPAPVKPRTRKAAGAGQFLQSGLCERMHPSWVPQQKNRLASAATRSDKQTLLRALPKGRKNYIIELNQ